jgi:hypothetical protein
MNETCNETTARVVVTAADILSRKPRHRGMSKGCELMAKIVNAVASAGPGVELRTDQIHDMVGGSQAAIYAALKACQRDGWLTPRLDGGRLRKYKLSPAGRAAHAERGPQ